MDNFTEINMGQAGSCVTYAGMGYRGGSQAGYAADGGADRDGFFQDAGVLEYNPFEDGMPMDGFQAGYPGDESFMEMEGNLPAGPGQVLVQEENQFMEYAESAVPEAGGADKARIEEPIQVAGASDELEPEELEEGCLDSEQEPGAEGLGAEKGNAAGNAVEDRECAEHEASEAERKAAWEARQQAKKDAEAAQLARLDSMGDDEVAAEAVKRLGADTEKLTRRNMKDCVSEYIQTLCLEDPAFARLAMHPRKTMINCFRYINRKAREFVEQEMKDNDIKPENGIYGSDVPDDLCYQWGEDYFRDPDAKEDQVEKEKFTPKPYAGKADSKAKQKKAEGKKGTAKKTADKKAEKPKQEDEGQISFMDQMTLGDIMAPEVKAG